MITLASIIVFLFASIIVLVFLWITGKLLISILRLFIISSALENLQPKSLAISLGITALIFSDTFNFLFSTIMNLFIAGFSITSNNLSLFLNHVLLDEWDKVANTLTDISLGASRLESILSKFSTYFNFSNLIVAFGVWIALALVLSGNEDTIKLTPVKNWILGLSTEARARIITGASLVFGAYLSLAAIIAIPWIQGTINSDPAKISQLKNELEGSFKTKAGLEKDWTVELGAEIERVVELESLISKTKIITPQNVSESLNQHISDIKQDHKLLKADWERFRESVISQSSDLSDTASNRFSRFLSQDSTAVDQNAYKDVLIQWYRNGIGDLNYNILGYRRYAKQRVFSWNNWAELYIDSYKSLNSSETIDVTVKAPWETRTRDDYNLDIYSWSDRNIPRPRETRNLGVFGYFSNWLVDVRSINLALISGMIGFGLFGSVISRTLIPPKDLLDQKIDRNSLDVLLVGVSAALIIFLASQGGLAIMSGGKIQPNPYILFLACFLGAAYGDRVWNTARIRFLRTLKEAEAVGSDKAAAQSAKPKSSPGTKKSTTKKAATKKSP